MFAPCVSGPTRSCHCLRALEAPASKQPGHVARRLITRALLLDNMHGLLIQLCFHTKDVVHFVDVTFRGRYVSLMIHFVDVTFRGSYVSWTLRFVDDTFRGRYVLWMLDAPINNVAAAPGKRLLKRSELELEPHSKDDTGVSGAVSLGLKAKSTRVNRYGYHHNLARRKMNFKSHAILMTLSTFCEEAGRV